MRGVSQSGYDARSTWHVLAGLAWILVTRVRRPAMASVDHSAGVATAALYTVSGSQVWQSELQCVRLARCG